MHPILLIVDSDSPNRFSSYSEEILRMEGICCYDHLDLSAAGLTPEALSGREVVILSDCRPAGFDSSLLDHYVSEGGALIAFRPPAALSKLFGITPTSGIVKKVNEGYVSFELDSARQLGLPAESLQFHGQADLYQLSGGHALGWLSGQLGLRTAYPALVTHSHGSGRTAAFVFDLAACTVLFHQGQQHQASNGPCPDPNADGAYKPDDFFFKYLDERVKTIPQADCYAHILVALIDQFRAGKAPVPRLWYYPAAAPAIAFLDGDSDNMTQADLDKVLEIVEASGGKFTCYLMTAHVSMFDRHRIEELRARGHDFGPHPFPGRMPTLEESRQNLKSEVGAFREKYAYQPVSQRTHNLIWAGWLENARYLRENGIRLDNNFLGFQHGFLTGTGLPFKFMDAEGCVLDIYEQTTVGMEDVWLTDKSLLPAMTMEEAIALSKKQIDEAADRFHSVYHPCFHPIYVSQPTHNIIEWVEAVTRHIRHRGIPFVNASEWVAFNDARRSVKITRLTWDASSGKSSFGITSDGAVVDLTLLLPARCQGRIASLENLEGVKKSGICVWRNQEYAAITLDLEAGQTKTLTIPYVSCT